MAGNMEKVGLRAVLETAEFQAGLRVYAQGLDSMTAQTDRAAKETAKATEEQARKQEAALQKVGLAFSAVGAAGTALLTSMAMTASRTEELGIILDVTATNAVRLAEAEEAAARESGDFAAAGIAAARASEISAQAVQAQVQAVKDLGITTGVASKTVAQLIRYNLDWKKSTDLARLAQDAATFAAQDSSEALDGLIHGITSLNPRVLRTYGILVNLEQEYSKFAEANNRTVTSLTDVEKQQIAFNAVLAQAPAIAGAYLGAMDSASKQLRSLSRDTTEVAEAFGQHLVPMLNSAVGALRDLLHWLADLPAPVQQTAVQVLAAGSAMASLVGVAAVVIPKLKALKQVFLDLKIAQDLMAAGMLGPAGIAVALAAVAGAAALYAYNLEQAHRKEAGAIADASESYTEYIRKIDAAGLSSYALSESLYEVAKSAEAAAMGIDAIVLTEAFRDLQFEIGGAVTGIEWLDAVLGKAAFQEAAYSTEVWAANLRGLVDNLSDAEIMILRNEAAVRQLGEARGYTGERLEEFVQIIMGAAQAQHEYNLAAAASEEHEQRRLTAMHAASDANREYEDTLRENIVWTDILAQREKARYDGLVALANAQDEYADASDAATKKAAGQMVAAEEKADDQRLKARQQLTSAMGDLEEDHADRVQDLLEDLADVDADLARDIIKAEQSAAQDRIDAARDMADALVDLERKLAQDREDAARDMARDIEDIERELAQDREDAARDYADDLIDLERERAQDEEDLARDLARDLEKIERDHERGIIEAREDYYADLEDLAREHNDRLRSIEERYAQEQRDIAKKYRMDPEEESFDDRREALQDEYRDLADQNDYYSRQRRAQIEKELAALQEEELAALEERKQAELEELEKWLAEEQAKRDEAYQKQLEEEQRAYDDRKAERERQYDEQLEDLATQNEREREEALRDYQQKLEDLEREAERQRQARQLAYDRELADLATRHEAEKQAIAQRNAERLAEIDTQLAEEKTRLDTAAEEQRQRIADQLADEQQNYAERRKELATHYDEQLAEIDTSLAEEEKKIQDALAEELKGIIDSLGEQSQAFRDAHAEQLLDLDNYLAERLKKESAYQEELKRLYGIQSPSRWMKEFREKIQAGWDAADVPLGFDLLGAARSGQEGLRGAAGGLSTPLPTLAPPAVNIQPPAVNVAGGARSTTIQNTRSYNLNADFSNSNQYPGIRDQFVLLEMAGEMA